MVNCFADPNFLVFSTKWKNQKWPVFNRIRIFFNIKSPQPLDQLGSVKTRTRSRESRTPLVTVYIKVYMLSLPKIVRNSRFWILLPPLIQAPLP